MLKHILLVGWLCAFSVSNYCRAQVITTGLPFLLISPDAEMNGMAETSVAVMTDNPLASMTNPAHLGMQSLTNYFSSGFNHSAWLPVFQMSDLWYETFAANVGINLNKLFNFSPEIGIGLGYSRIYVNLGKFALTLDSPEPIETFNAYEFSNQFTIGFGINYGIKVAAGITLKSVTSNLAPYGAGEELGKGRAEMTTYDYGFLVNVPCISLITEILHEPLQITSKISPEFDLNFGFANNNLGNKGISYIDAAQADPLPRYARVGWGINIGLLLKDDDLVWEPFSFHWTREANDILVRNKQQGTNLSGNWWEYQSGFGNIDIYRELLLNKSNPETNKLRGSEFNLFETFSIRNGRYEEDPYRGNRRFNTSGIGMHTTGIFKLFGRIFLKEEGNGIFKFLVTHLDIRYDQSTIHTDEPDSPLANTQFKSIKIVISN